MTTPLAVGTIYKEYRALWSDPDGMPCAIRGTSIETLRQQLAGWGYGKPDLRFEVHTITVGRWVPADIEELGL